MLLSWCCCFASAVFVEAVEVTRTTVANRRVRQEGEPKMIVKVMNRAEKEAEVEKEGTLALSCF